MKFKIFLDLALPRFTSNIFNDTVPLLNIVIISACQVNGQNVAVFDRYALLNRHFFDLQNGA